MQRSYHAWFSRFDQPDPWDGSYDLTNPQSFNRYAYVHNDPVNFTDPSGLDEVPFVDGGTVTVTGTYYDYALQERALSGGRLGGGISPRRLLPLDPPNPVLIPPQDLRGNVQKLLNKGDCADFVQKLLNKAAELFPKNSPHVNNILEAFDKISSQGGYRTEVQQLPGLPTPGGTVSGDLFANGALPATVYLNPFYSYGAPNAMVFAQAQARYAYNALHETFHLAAKGGFNDEQMARAAFALTGARGLPSGETTNPYLWSNYFNSQLKKHCPE